MAPVMEKRRPFEELSEVRLTHAVEAEGFVVPSGATGVVIAAYADGLACEVEFESPRHVVLTLEAADMRPAKEDASPSAGRGQRELPA
jgi:hypothetical protein